MLPSHNQLQQFFQALPHPAASSSLALAMSSQPSPIDQTVRMPLSNSTNDSRLQHASLPSSAQAVKSLRRKFSFQAGSFKNSYTSGSDPSEHNSIFEALLYSSVSNDENLGAAEGDSSPSRSIFVNEGAFVTGGRVSSTWQSESQAQKKTTNKIIDPAFTAPLHSLHFPTPLSTITEQPSWASLRPDRKASLLTILSHRPSAPHLISSLKSQHRKRSFSDTGPFTKRQAYQTSSASSSITHLVPHETACYPSQPLVPPPPERVPTPPGLPTFNTPAAVAFRLPPPQLRLRDIFRITSTPAEIEYHRQTIGLPKGVVMRGEGGVLVRGKWRADRSAHTGPTGYPPGMDPRNMLGGNDNVGQDVETNITSPEMNAGMARQAEGQDSIETESSPLPRTWSQFLTTGFTDLSNSFLLQPSHLTALGPEQQPHPLRSHPPQPGLPNPIHSHPVQPGQTQPDQTQPDQIQPDPVHPDPIQPDPITPNPVHSIPIHPEPVLPEPVHVNPHHRPHSPSPPSPTRSHSPRQASHSSTGREARKQGKWEWMSSLLRLVCCRAEKSESEGLHRPRSTGNVGLNPVKRSKASRGRREEGLEEGRG